MMGEGKKRRDSFGDRGSSREGIRGRGRRDGDRRGGKRQNKKGGIEPRMSDGRKGAKWQGRPNRYRFPVSFAVKKTDTRSFFIF